MAVAQTGSAGRNEMLLAAREAGLRYVDPSDPGIRRVRRGKGFVYLGDDGKQVMDERTLGADTGHRDPAGLDRRVDQPDCQRPHPGRGP